MFRVGTGFDIHKLIEGNKLILGGVLIPFSKGALAHSDGDALSHAIIDAILGASGLEDIGTQFPDTSEEYKNFSSLTMLRIVNDLIRENDFSIINVDSTIILQKPNLSSFKDKMRSNVAGALDLDVSQVNVKAKTAEFMLGELGTSDAVAVQAVVLLEELSLF